MPLINIDTGEVIKKWEYRADRVDAPKEKIRIRVYSKDGTFTEKNIGCYITPSPDELEDLHNSIFGDLHQIEDNRKYTKLYQCHRPPWTQQIYKAYWHEVVAHVTMNNGVIYWRDSHKQIFPVKSITDWTQLIEASRTATYNFLREAQHIRAIAKLIIDSDHYYIVNPIYCWNGNEYPEIIWSLFSLDQLFKIQNMSTRVDTSKQPQH